MVAAVLQREQPAPVVLPVLHRACKACLQRCSVQRASAGARLQGALQPKNYFALPLASVLQDASSLLWAKPLQAPWTAYRCNSCYGTVVVVPFLLSLQRALL